MFFVWRRVRVCIKVCVFVCGVRDLLCLHVWGCLQRQMCIKNTYNTVLWVAGVCHVTRILFSEWLVCVTWLEYCALIGWCVSRDYNTALWLAGVCHVTRILLSEWLVCVTWLEFCVLIGWCVSRDYNTALWLAGVRQVTRIPVSYSHLRAHETLR